MSHVINIHQSFFTVAVFLSGCYLHSATAKPRPHSTFLSDVDHDPLALLLVSGVSYVKAQNEVAYAKHFATVAFRPAPQGMGLEETSISERHQLLQC